MTTNLIETYNNIWIYKKKLKKIGLNGKLA